jgi:hypothetical protein
MKGTSRSLVSVNHEPVQTRDRDALESGLILIDEYRFPHAVFPLTGSDLNPEGMKYGYNKI